MNRSGFLSASAVGLAGSTVGAASPATAAAGAASTPSVAKRKASTFFDDKDMNFIFLGMLGGAYEKMADVGALLAMVDEIEDGNAESAFTVFTTNAGRLRTMARLAHAAGRNVTAREQYLQASSYAYAATYFCDRMKAPERMQPTWQLARDDMNAGFALLARPVERVSIPYQGTTLPGYFFKVDNSGKPRPLLILNNGSDGSVLDMTFTGAGALGGLERDYNCLTFDGPGQGAALWLQHLYFRPDWEKVITPVVDFALTRPDVDPKRVALQGISQGGYWVPRAVAFEHRIAAAVADPGCVDVSTSWLSGLPAPIVQLLQSGSKEIFDKYLGDGKAGPVYAIRARPYGLPSPYDTYKAVETYSLAGGVTDTIRCPMLITDPDGEQFFPGQSQKLYDLLKSPKTLVRFTVAEGGEYHCEPMATGLHNQRIFDWLDDTLARVR
jgi:hypothetical protein